MHECFLCIVHIGGLNKDDYAKAVSEEISICFVFHQPSNSVITLHCYIIHRPKNPTSQSHKSLKLSGGVCDGSW